MEVSFEGLQGADLVVDTVYKGGKISGKGSEVNASNIVST